MMEVKVMSMPLPSMKKRETLYYNFPYDLSVHRQLQDPVQVLQTKELAGAVVVSKKTGLASHRYRLHRSILIYFRLRQSYLSWNY
jgi:hypothetical protein